jgi:hypothetical protein
LAVLALVATPERAIHDFHVPSRHERPLLFAMSETKNIAVAFLEVMLT